jgi:hypothetical protein
MLGSAGGLIPMDPIEFGIPPGEPDSLRGAAGRLRLIAADVDRHGAAVVAEQRGLAAVWTSDRAAPAAIAEVGRLGALAGGHSPRIAAGAAALRDYAAALDHAQRTVADLRRRDTLAEQEARAEASRTPQLPAEEREDLFRAEYGARRRSLEGAYHTETSRLAHAAQICRSRLENAVPGYRPGMSPGQTATAARRAVTSALPTVWAADQTRQARQDAAELQAAVESGRCPDPELVRRIGANARDEHYAAAFATWLGAGTLLGLPYQIGRSGLDDTGRRDLMRAVGAVAGTATNGAGPDLPTGDADELVRRAGSTERADDRHLYQGYWAVTQLLGYGSGTFGKDFLARIAEEIYHHRGKLRAENTIANPDQRPVSSADHRWIGDPMLVVLQELSKNPAAGRLFFAVRDADGKLSRVRALMSEYCNTGHTQERTVTDAVAEAATEFPPGERKGAEGRRGADIASYFLHYAAEQRRDHTVLWAETRQAVTKVLTTYYEDLRIALITQTTDGPGHRDPGHRNHGADSESKLPVQTGALLSSAEARSLTAEVWGEEKLRRQLLTAAATRAELSLRHELAAEGLSAKEVTEKINNAFGVYGSDVGMLLSAAYGERMHSAEFQSECLRATKVIFDVGAVTVARPAGGAAAVALDIFKEIGDGGFDPGNPVDGVRAGFAEAMQDLRTGIRATAVELLLRSGQWTREYAPGEPPWKWWDATQGRLVVPADPSSRTEFALWLNDHAGAEMLAPEQAFVTGLERAAPPVLRGPLL